VLFGALALGELGLELELELEHPAVPSRPAATTVVPSHVAVRKLKIFTRTLVCDPGDARRSGARGADERPVAGRRPDPKGLVNTPLGCALHPQPDHGVSGSAGWDGGRPRTCVTISVARSGSLILRLFDARLSIANAWSASQRDSAMRMPIARSITPATAGPAGAARPGRGPQDSGPPPRSRRRPAR